MTDQEAADYLFEELTKLDAPILYTACKALVARIKKPSSEPGQGMSIWVVQQPAWRDPTTGVSADDAQPVIALRSRRHAEEWITETGTRDDGFLVFKIDLAE